MGTHIFCKTNIIEAENSASYTYWNNLKLSVINTFIKYLIDWTRWNCSVESNTFKFNKESFKNLYNFIDEINNIKELDIDNFINIISKYQSELNCFGFGGLFCLICNKNGGFYWSPGNAYDIDCLIKQINHLIEEQYNDSITSLKKVLEYSITNNEPICIA
jgi:hypothetical protein